MATAARLRVPQAYAPYERKMTTNTIPTIQQIKALDGRIFATLTATESEVCRLRRLRGRTFGVTAFAQPSGSDTVLKVKLIFKEIGVERDAGFDNTIDQANQFVHGGADHGLGCQPLSEGLGLVQLPSCARRAGGDA